MKGIVLPSVVMGPIAAVITLLLGGIQAGTDDQRASLEQQLTDLGARVRKDAAGNVFIIQITANSKRFSDEEIDKINFSHLGHVNYLAITDVVVSDRALVQFAKIPNLSVFVLRDAKITDEGFLRFLKDRKSLHSLVWDGTPITPRVLTALSAHKHIRAIEISNIVLGNSGVREVAKIEKLFALDLPNTKITDAALVEIANLKNLAFLRLDNNNITDAGLEHLGNFNNLFFLELRDTKVTNEGVKKLQMRLPRLKIEQ